MLEETLERPAANKNLHIAANVLSVANIFIWFLLAFNVINLFLVPSAAESPHSLLVLGANCGAIALSALLGTLVFSKINRESFLFLWISIGVVISLIPLVLNMQDLPSLLITSIIFGAYFGLGMPATLGYFSNSITIEKRAKTSGITFLLIGLLSSILGMMALNNLVLACIILAAIRLFGLISFRPLMKKDAAVPTEISQKQVNYLSKKSFALYFIPWGIFCLVNYMTIPVIEVFFADYTSFIKIAPVLENVVIAISAVIGGILADRLGRKRLIMVGFVMLGIGFAALGLLSGENVRIIAGYIYTVSDGVAWGIFNVMFLLTIWGDLAQGRGREILFALGALPFIFANFMRLLLHPLLGGIIEIQVFSFASIFLFLAVLPLLYAPETLPEAVMKNRDLNSYVKKAVEKAKKESGRNKAEGKNLQACIMPEEKSDESPEYEEARKLAEKYY